MLSTSSRARRLLAAVCIALALVGSGCSDSREIERVTTAVRDYNTQLVRAFAAHDMNLLGTVATRDQAYTEYSQMAALGESGLTLHATLRDITFDSVSFSGDASATADTTETWDYKHVSNDTSETVRTESGVTYRLRYQLVLRDERWLVSDVRSLDTTGTSQTTTPSEVTTP
ncbi:MAG: hypothetical protein LLG08_09435 [Actinomycetia bacterium]|nr:hypothetical protein [Actinomycetes bacterium]